MKKWMIGLAVCFALSTAIFATDFDQNVAVLHMMGVMEGDGKGDFMPEQNLTRSQFCKMAVVIMGEADQEPLYRNRTVFPDVLSSHWARGYINLAVATTIGGEEGTQLIRGLADGTFAPDRNITYGESVTILMRMLGYSDLDAGMLWPQGYLDLAGKVGLTDGLALTANQSMTRQQATTLFTNLLLCQEKNGAAYYNSLGSGQEDVVLTDVDVTLNNAPAIDTTAGMKKLVSGAIAPDLLGLRGALVTDESGNCIAFIPQGNQETLVVDKNQAGWFTDVDGETYLVEKEVNVYFPDGESLPYEEAWLDIHGGTTLMVYYDDNWEINGMFVANYSKMDTLVAPEVGSGNPFAPLLVGATGYTIYRDGTLATTKDIATYDVGRYNPATNILYISTGKVTGRYEKAYPNLESPTEITVMGTTLPVLPMAMSDLAKFEYGDDITLLLTEDCYVAGAVSASKIEVDNLGIVTAVGTQGEVALLNGATAKCEIRGSVMEGDLVNLESNSRGDILVHYVTQLTTRDTFYRDSRKVGGDKLSQNCRFFDRVGYSGLLELDYEDILLETVPASGISYIHHTPEGTVDLVVFENLTGDLYTYGKIFTCGEDSSYPDMALYWENHEDTGPVLYNQWAMPAEFYGGLVESKAKYDDLPRAAGICTLTRGDVVNRSDFVLLDGAYYVTTGGQRFLVAEEVQCYNDTTDEWFASLAEARAFSDQLTVYYDKTAKEGGKIRVIVANEDFS